MLTGVRGLEGQVPSVQLEPEDPHSPDVDGTVIHVLLQQQFGCALPECHHFVAITLGYGLHVAGQPLVSDFDIHVCVDQHVVQFDVPVHQLACVDMVKPDQHLEHDPADILVPEEHLKFLLPLAQVLEVLWHVLHHHQLLPAPCDHVHQFDDLLAGAALQAGHDRDLPKCGLVDAVVHFLLGQNEAFHGLHLVVLLHFLNDPLPTLV